MRDYYTNHPICPYCLEPAKNDKDLIECEKSNLFSCSNCGNKFNELVELDTKKGIKTVFPLFSRINLNPIESSYVDWVLEDDFSGKYFITWPWENVKFIPILLSEYFLKNKKNKLLVFYNSKDVRNKFSELNYEFSLDSIYLNNNSDNASNNPNITKLNIEQVFEKNIQGYCKIYVNSLNINNIKKYEKIISNLSRVSPIFKNLEEFSDYEFSCGFVDNEKSCFKKFLNEFKSLFGSNSVKKIVCCGKEYNVTHDGLFDLFFYESLSYGSNLLIDNQINDSFWKCFNDSAHLISVFKNMTHIVLDEDNFSNFDENDNFSIIFMDSNLMSSKILEFITNYNPNLIISTDIDNLFGKKRFRHDNPMNKLLRMNYDMLLFSTNLNRRSVYKIGSPESFLKKRNIIAHTWDHKDVLNQISLKNKCDVSLFSSNMENLQGMSSSLEIKFETCEELAEIENCLEIFDKIFSNNKHVHDYIEDLIKTPVYVFGDNETSFYRPNMSLDYLLDISFNSDEDCWNKLNFSFKNVFGDKENSKNPLLIKIIDMIKINLKNEEETVVVVNYYDIKKLRIILDNVFGQDRILVTNWNNLNNNLLNTSIKKGIATEFPTLTYNLYKSPLKEITIVGGPYTIEKFEGYKNNRFTHKGTKPLYILSEDEKGPKILFDCLKNINVDVEDIDSFNEEINEIINIDDGKTEIYQENSSKQYLEIKKGTNALLIFSNDDRAMILPFDKRIGTLDKGIKMIDIQSNKSNYDNLLKKQIIINNPLNMDFLKFVIENGDNIIVKYNGHFWNGFKELIESMYEWVDLLNKIIYKECNETNKSIKEVKNELVEKIKASGVNAQTAAYIKGNWLSDPFVLETSMGNINIYDAERPWEAEDIYKLYAWISREYPDFSIPSFEAYKTYDAAIRLQEIRSYVFKNDDFWFDDDLKQLNNDFQEFIVDKFNQSDLFTIESYSLGKVKQDIKPYKILEDYENYFEEF